MNIRIREPAAIFIFICFMLIPIKSFSHETEDVQETAEALTESPEWERRFFADLGHAVFGVTLSNVSINYLNRLAGRPYSETTFVTIKRDFLEQNWIWEPGDRFFVNQFLHPLHGSTYFASGRVSGFNFYESLLFAPLGSYMWEISMEPGAASINDLISSSLGGISLGEILHRLFLEINASPSAAGRAVGSLLNPVGGLASLYKRPFRESGGGNIYRLSVRAGIYKAFVSFPGHEDFEVSWNYPGGYFGLNAVYGNPFIQQSKKPYNHFELLADVSYNIESIQLSIISDGYLFSYNPIHTDRSIVSTGLSMHCDIFHVANDILGNLGYGNIQFSSNAIGWTLKNKYFLSEKSNIEFQTHAAVILWGCSLYNADTETVPPWGNHFSMENLRGTYGPGECVKLGFSFFNNKAGRLDFTANGYHLFPLPLNENHSAGNLFFINSSLSYEFPIGKTLGIGFRTTLWWMLGLYDEAENVRRSLISNSLYIRFEF